MINYSNILLLVVDIRRWRFYVDTFLAIWVFEISSSDTITSSLVILSASLYEVIHVFLWRGD